MQELIRLNHVDKSNKDGKILSDYNVTIFKGEILCIEYSNRQGKEYLKRILTGKEQVDEGMIYYRGKKINKRKLEQVLKRACFAIENQAPVIDEMSIKENLAALKPVTFPFRAWNEKGAGIITSDILKAIELHHNPQTFVGTLSQAEKMKLCIAKAAMSGVELIILSDTMNVYRECEILELGKLMQRYCKKGISFLIFANKEKAFYKFASRIQLMSGGRDLMEWQGQEAMIGQKVSDSSIKQQKPADSEQSGKILYLIDNNWNGLAYGKEYLYIFKENNHLIWSKYIACLLEKENSSDRIQCIWQEGNPIFDGVAVWIPYNSAELLLENMTLEDNISICIPKRTKKWGAIHKQARKLLKKEFLSRVHRNEEVDSIQEISLWERKALSIYRWELAKPKVFLIDDPFTELDIRGIQLLDAYLGDVRKKGMDIIIFLSERNPYIRNYDQIIMANNGKEGKVEEYPYTV